MFEATFGTKDMSGCPLAIEKTFPKSLPTLLKLSTPAQAWVVDTCTNYFTAE